MSPLLSQLFEIYLYNIFLRVYFSFIKIVQGRVTPVYPQQASYMADMSSVTDSAGGIPVDALPAPLFSRTIKLLHSCGVWRSLARSLIVLASHQLARLFDYGASSHSETKPDRTVCC